MIMKYEDIQRVISLEEAEKRELLNYIHSTRIEHIRTPKEIIRKSLEINSALRKQLLEGHKVSEFIVKMREVGWSEFLKDESKFNTQVINGLSEILSTPKSILSDLIEANIQGKTGDELVAVIRDLCGEYFGRVFPYIYELSLSNTQSRRSRAGQTFEAIVYSIYETLGYSYDSQKKIGRKTFDEAGLGKKVDSVLPSMDAFLQMRTKTIIGTMKTTLRERWQEVAEEIERTKVPQIYLLTVDSEIAPSKAEEMGHHNIIVVGLEGVASSEALKKFRNIISFEKYFYEEIPLILKYWEQ